MEMTASPGATPPGPACQGHCPSGSPGRWLPLCLLLALFLCAPSSGKATDIGRETGEELLERCEPALALLAGDEVLEDAQRESAVSCIAFLEGFIWGHGWSAWREDQDMYYCPPEGFSGRQAVPAVVDYLRREAHRRIQPAHLLVFAALSRTWPCTPLPSPP